MKRRLLLLLVAVVLLSAVTAFAHHSFTSTYDDEKTVKLDGKIVQFMFRNPHSFVAVEAPDAKGVMQRWGVEWGGAGQLGGQGVNRYSLKVGDEVTITGRLGRSWESDHRVLMVTLKRKSDGFGWGGNPGEIVPNLKLLLFNARVSLTVLAQ